jgi:AcrR family transcriptional regulator
VHPSPPDDPELPDSARHGRPRDDSREQAILDAALEAVAEVGYERLTIDGVAARAHASKATIYRRWPGKAELVVDAFKRRVAEPVTIPDAGSLRAELLDTMRLVCSHIGGLDGNLLCGLAGSCQGDPELAACFKQMIAEKDSPLAPVISRAVARGELTAGADPALVDEVAPAVAMMRALQGEPLDDAFARHLVDDICLPLLIATTDPSAIDPSAIDPSTTDPTDPHPPTGITPPPAKESR